MKVQEVFNKGAQEYDSARKQLIPCYDDFYGTALELIPFSCDTRIKVLDLGAGTGLLSSYISKLYPHAQFTLCDISEKMISGAQNRFKDTDIDISYVIQDYAIEPIAGEYDLIISALSVHHLTHDLKEELFQRLYSALNQNGMFINADQVLGDTDDIEKCYRDAWLKQVRNKGVNKVSLASALERMEEDKMSTLSDQLTWLRDAGFKEVNNWYQSYSFVVYSGKK